MLLLAGAIASGCGESEEDRVAEAVRGYLTAVENEDAEAACARLTPATQDDFLLGWNHATTPTERVRSCPAAFRKFVDYGASDALVRGVADLGAFDADDLPDVPVEEIEVGDDYATARVGKSRDKARLLKVGGDWRIAELDLGLDSDGP